MNRIMIGLGLLALLLAYQWGRGRLRMARMRQAWEAALFALKDNNLEEAEQRFNQCVRLMPMWTPARFMLGGVLAKRERFAEAEAQLKMGADLEPRSADGHVQLGMFYLVCQPARADDAIASLEQAVACNPALRERFAKEPQLAPLRAHPRFQRLINTEES